MANMTECVKCNASMAKSADGCPKCGFPAPRNLAYCRTCNQVLARTRYRYRAYSASTVIINGNSVGGSSSIVHVPCPNCGEKKPLRQFTDTALGNPDMFVATIAIVAVAIGSYYVVTPNRKSSEGSGASDFGPTKIQIQNTEKTRKLADALYGGRKVTMVTTTDLVVADQGRTFCTVPKGRRVQINKWYLQMVQQDIWLVKGFFADLCPGSAEQEPRDERHSKAFNAERPDIE